MGDAWGVEWADFLMFRTQGPCISYLDAQEKEVV
jgi:hypothetical protein